MATEPVRGRKRLRCRGGTRCSCHVGPTLGRPTWQPPHVPRLIPAEPKDDPTAQPPDPSSMALSSADDEKKTAAEIVAALDLQRHPDGGFYLETFRDPSVSLPSSALPPRYKVDRAVSSAIYFLLPAGEIARLHRIPCAETWHYYLGEPLTVFEVLDDGQIKMTVVGPDLRHGQRPQYTVPPNVWFGAFLTCDIESFDQDGSVFIKTPGRDPAVHYSFVGVTCAPAFQFEDNELATREDMKVLAPKAEAFINYLVPS